jgi:hypothetical protein
MPPRPFRAPVGERSARQGSKFNVTPDLRRITGGLDIRVLATVVGSLARERKSDLSDVTKLTKSGAGSVSPRLRAVSSYGVGVFTTDQAVPFHCSTSAPVGPPLAEELPTAMHVVGAGHATPASGL